MKTLEQEETNHMFTRIAWDKTSQERDDLKNQVKALSAIKDGLENSLIDINSKIDNVIDIMKKDRNHTGSVDKKVIIGNYIDLIKNEFKK